MHFSKKLTKKSKKWRGALIYLALFGVAPMAFGTETETRYVSDYNGLRAAISDYNENTGSDFKIVLKGSITLAGELPAITGNADLVGVKSGSLTIDGAGYTLNGADQYRGLYVDGADADVTVAVSNLTFSDCFAKGGDGGEGASGAGGGMGAGAAIYAYSGNVVLSDVAAVQSVAVGGNGGSVLYGSNSYAGGGGLGGNGGSGKLLEGGAANGGGIFTDGAASTPDALAGDGGVTSDDNLDSYAHTVPGTTTPVGGDSLAGGGGGGSTAYGGAGGFGGGGGAGAAYGGAGGFGGGGGGGDSAITAGAGGFGAGDGGYVDEVESSIFASTPGGGTGGGGAALGGAIFVGNNANLTIAVSKDSYQGIKDGALTAGTGGGGTAEDGEAIGGGIFLLNDLTIQVAEGGTYEISDSIGGFAGSKKVSADKYGNYENTSGIIKTGEGTLVLNAGDSSYTGDTTVKAGTVVANTTGALSSYSGLNVESGSVELNADQTVRNLNGGTAGSVDLNSRTLTISGDGEDGLYAGTFKGAGTLVKNGSSALTLAGDSRDEDDKDFNTVLNGGTIRVYNDGAFGDGKVYYTRSNADDQTSALDFADGITMANDLVLDGNSNALILSGGSATLSGQIIAKPGSNREIILRLNDGKSVHLTNTGVTTDEEGKIVHTGGNSASQVTFDSGSALIDVTSYEEDGVRYWYSSLGDATIVSNSDSSLGFVLKTDDVDAGLRFSNDIVTNAGYLTIDPVTLKDSGDQVKNIYAEGKTTGNGGLRIDVGANATYNVLGSLGQAYTDVNSGTLNVANVSTSAAYVGGLTSSGYGAVDAGSKDLVVNFNDKALTYSGKIVGDGDGANVYKIGSGAWTLNLTNNSKVNLVNVTEGTLSLGENHYESGMYADNDFAIVVGPNGTFAHTTTSGETLRLNNFDASRGGAIVIGDNDELELTGENTTTSIAANLNGGGWLFLDNVKDGSGAVQPWVLSGNNSNWSGDVAAYDSNAQITLASANAGSANSSINFGSHGTLNVSESTALGSLVFDDNASIVVSSGKTLGLGSLTSSALWLDDSVLTVDGGGTVKLAEKAAANYLGQTTVTNGSTLLLNGDNTTTGARRALTLTGGGVLAMDYTNAGSSEALSSYWGSEIDVEGEGTISVASNATSGPVVMNETIGYIGTEPSTLTFNVVGGTVKLDSAIEGSGTLDKIGNGSLILNGTGAFAEAIVENGVLQLGVGASNPGEQLKYADLTINGGSVTGWTDSLGSVNLTSGALKLNNTGTVNLTGSGSVFSMSDGNLYVNVIDETHYTNFKAEDATATAQMDGGNIYVDTDTYGADLSLGDRLRIVDVNPGNLTANASNFTIFDDYAGMRFVVDQSDIADGYFTLLLKKNSFSEFARTPNERSVARYLDNWQDGPRWDSKYEEFFTSLENAVEANPGVLNQLTGELRFSAMNAQVQSRNLMRQTLTRNVMPSPTLSGCRGVNSCYSSIRGQSWNYAGANEPAGLAGWASMYGAGGNTESVHGNSGYDYSMMGGMFGVELGGTASNQFGFYYTYSNMDVDSGSYMGDVEVGDNIFGLYGRLSDDYGYTFATGTLGVADYTTSRGVSVGSNWFEGETDGWSGSAYLERGFTFCLPMSTVHTYGGLQYTHIKMDAFTETGSYSPIALITTDTEYDSLQGVLGVRWMKSIIGPQTSFDLSAYANWTHEFLDESVEGDLRMAAGPNKNFHIIGNGAGRDWVYAGLGGDWLLSSSFDLFGGADVQTNAHTTYVYGNGGFRIKW